MIQNLDNKFHIIHEDSDSICCYMDISWLQNEETYHDYLTQVSDYRAEKSNRMRFISGKAQSLGVGLALDYCLSRRYNLREKDMLYLADSLNKPVFSNHPDIHFNASHSGDYVALIMSNKEVGVDIQQMEKFDSKIAKRFFSENEYNFISSQIDDKQKKDAFYRIWTLKESFIKFTGEGMSRELNSFEFDLTQPKVELTILNQDQPNLIKLPTFYEYAPIEGYRLALCLSL